MFNELLTALLILLSFFADGECRTNSGLQCDFEQSCPWTFVPKDGFRVVSGKEKSGKSGHYAFFGTSQDEEVVAKIVSPYLQSTGANCKLRFSHRLHGMPKTELLVVLEHLPDPTEQTSWAPMLLRHFPAKSGITSKWSDETVPIGSIRSPMRIQLEAWMNNQRHGQHRLSYPADCMIDEISLVDCQEVLYHADPCQNGSWEKYRCELNQLCIDWDQLCDMKADCFDGEDELPALHNCTRVPTGARCTFEDDMCGWMNSSDGDFRFMRVNASYQQYIERELGQKDFTNDHTYGNTSGHFMYVEHGSADNLAHAYFTSPKFPPMSKQLANESSPYYNQCRIRFFYWHFGRNNHLLDLAILSDGFKSRKKIWEDDQAYPSASELLDSTRWMRVSVIIPPQNTEYQLQFLAFRLASYRGHLGIDDVSMTPQCFLEDESADFHISYVYSFGTCGASGPIGPNQSQCDAAYNQTSSKVKILGDGQRKNSVIGYQIWRVPMTGEYRIEAAGAAGGSVWENDVAMAHYNVKGRNYGAEIQAVFRLEKNEQLLLAVGQRGSSICASHKRENANDVDRKSAAIQILDKLCSVKNFKNFNVEYTKTNKSNHARKLRRRRRLLAEPQLPYVEDGEKVTFFVGDLPGAGGGGATVIFKLQSASMHPGNALVMAAGGGGIFAGALRSNANWTNVGGNGMANHRMPVAGSTLISGPTAAAGAGGGLVYSDSGSQMPPSDTTRNSVNSHLYLAGGQCPHNFGQRAFNGGFGGGGASCGFGGGGGGGGGFAGGSGGNLTHGEGGYSYVDSNLAMQNSVTIMSNWNAGNGYIRIYPCLAKCVDGSVCQFVNNVQRCRCPSGYLVEQSSPCPVAPATSSTAGDAETKDNDVSESFLVVIIITVSLVIPIGLIIIVCIVCRRNCRQKHSVEKYKRYINAGVGEMGGVPMHQFPDGRNFHTEFNPNYEMFNNGTLQDLKEVPRNCVTLIKALGQGAFGEVYEGLLNNCVNETNNLPVAVKSLPEFATEQAQMDFHMEALIMSKFNHPNIVRFIGVCFEKMPRFIILELLAGGDLKTFLRENRPRPGVTNKLCTGDLIRMALDVGEGCQYLEENHFIHRDIAARNCLLTTKGDSNRVVKIADFGMARDIYRADYYRKGGKAMLPVKWMPPEAFLDGIFTTKTDVWSFGVLLWEIFSLGYMPYPGRGNQEVMQLVTAGGRLEAPTGCPAPIYQIMTQTWHTNADQRPKFSTIIERLGYCLQDPDVIDTPLPVLARNTPVTVESSSALGRDMQNSVNSFTPSMSDVDVAHQTGKVTTMQIPEPMPTKGTGVTPSACPAYQPQSPDALCDSAKQSVDSSSDCTDSLLKPSIPDTQTTEVTSDAPPSSTAETREQTPDDDEVFIVGANHHHQQSSNLSRHSLLSAEKRT